MPPRKKLLDKEQQTLIEAQLPRVRQIAQGLARKLPASVDRADLEQDGMLGLMEALLRWSRATTGDHFQNYVALRATGAMLDGLRARDHGMRQVRAKMRKVELAIQHLEHSLGRAARAQEIAQTLDMSLDAYQQLLQDVDGYMLISLEDLGGGDAQSYFLRCASEHSDPLAVLERKALKIALSNAIVSLPQPMQRVLKLYYSDGLKMHAIAVSMELTEARISQLHTQAIAHLRAAMPDGDIAQLLKPRARERR